jgi:hypothetical protein
MGHWMTISYLQVLGNMIRDMGDAIPTCIATVGFNMKFIACTEGTMNVFSGSIIL